MMIAYFISRRRCGCGMSAERVNDLTKIDLWYLTKLKGIIDLEEALKSGVLLDKQTLKKAKKMGFSDRAIAGFTRPR